MTFVRIKTRSPFTAALLLLTHLIISSQHSSLSLSVPFSYYQEMAEAILFGLAQKMIEMLALQNLDLNYNKALTKKKRMKILLEYFKLTNKEINQCFRLFLI